MRITTKAIFDIESGELLHAETFDYYGPIAHCGGLFANLTKAGVQNNGQTSYYDNPAQATQALAKASAATASPSTANIGSDADLNATAGNMVTPVPAPQPTMVRPRFATATPDQLTTKGSVLRDVMSMLQSGLTGAEMGAVASSQGSSRSGYPSGLVGLVGVNAPNVIAQERNRLMQDQLEQDKERAQIAALPAQQQMARALQQSEIDRNTAIANRKDVFQAKDGSILERQSDGTMKTLYQAPDKPDLAETVDGRQQIVASMKAAAFGTPEFDAAGNLTGRSLGPAYTLTPAQEASFVLTGKIPESKESNPNQTELLLRAAQGDATALKALQLQSDNEIRTHRGFQQDDAAESGLTAAQQRSLKADAQWSGLNRRYAALATEYAKNAAAGLDTSSLSSQMDSLATAMDQRKDTVLQSSGKLRLAGTIPLMSSHTPSVNQTAGSVPVGAQPIYRDGRTVGYVLNGKRVNF